VSALLNKHLPSLWQIILLDVIQIFRISPMIVKNVKICQSDNSPAVFHSSWNTEEHKISFQITEISRM
jgi:hypothetical protein